MAKEKQEVISDLVKLYKINEDPESTNSADGAFSVSKKHMPEKDVLPKLMGYFTTNTVTCVTVAIRSPSATHTRFTITEVVEK